MEDNFSMRTIRLFTISIFFVILTAGSSFSQTRNLTNIDSPTAFTLGRGNYALSLMGYDNGGIEIKTLLGLHDMLFLGVSLDFQNAIGSETPKLNVPGVVARLKFTDGWDSWPISIAAGYDSFYIGRQGMRENSSNEVDRVIYGPYIAFTKPIYLLGGEQYVSYGFRMPTQPDYEPDESSYFLALDFPLNDMFRVKTEIERVFWDFRDGDEWLFNFGMRYTYMQRLGIEFDFLYQPGESINRILKIEYVGIF